MPAWLGAFEGRRTTLSLVVRHATVDVYERLPMTAPSIRQDRRRAVTMCFATFHLRPQFKSRLSFGWPDAASDT